MAPFILKKNFVDNCRPIGGYFGLEINQKECYHTGQLAFNAGRYALQYILEKAKPRKVWIPDYRCDTICEPLEKLGIPYGIYKLSKEFLPTDIIPVKSGELVLFINYFGLCENQVNSMRSHYELIVDYTHSFFSSLGSDEYAFNSARKFFGVTDGAYSSFYKGESHELTPFKPRKWDHLFLRLDGNVQEGFEVYKKSEKCISSMGMHLISQLSQQILNSIDYDEVMRKRRENFLFVHERLKELNELSDLCTLSSSQVPYAYPLLLDGGADLRNNLIEEKVFVPLLWPEVLKNADDQSCASHFAQNILPLPVDQRYDLSDMKKLVRLVLKVNRGG